MDRLLKVTSKVDQVPGLSYSDSLSNTDSISDKNSKPIDVKDIQAQRQNAEFQQLFNLPEQEDLVNINYISLIIIRKYIYIYIYIYFFFFFLYFFYIIYTYEKVNTYNFIL